MRYLFFLILILFPALLYAQDDVKGGLFDSNQLSQDMFDSSDESRDVVTVDNSDVPKDVQVDSSKTDKQIDQSKSAPSLGQASSVISRVKGLINQGSVVPRDVIEKARAGQESLNALDSPSEEVSSHQELQEALEQADGQVSDNEDYIKKRAQALSLVVSANDKRDFITSVENMYRTQKNKNVTLGEVLLVAEIGQEVSSYVLSKYELDQKYNLPFVQMSFAASVPKHLLATSSPFWVVRSEGVNYVFELGRKNPASLFDRNGNLLIPKDKNKYDNQ